MIRFMLAFCLAIGVSPLHAERVRVVVAVGVPEVSALGVESLRANVIGSLSTATRIEKWGDSPAFAAEVDRAELDALRRDPRVQAVSLDTGGEGALHESVPLVRGDVVHARGITGKGVTIAVLDTGIDVSNADFAGRIVAQRCFCDNLDGTGCCPNGMTQQSTGDAAVDDHGHGTHVSGILAGSGAWSIRGVAPEVQIVAVKVMDKDNSFKSFTQIHRALDWIANERLDVKAINMSLGSFALYGTSDCGTAATAIGLRDVIAKLRQRGVVITASSGNNGSITQTTLPACMADVMGVGAVYDTPGDHTAFCSAPGAKADQVTCFTNSTDALDIVAPGAPISATRRGGGSIVFSGTSMAAPHVAGAVALMQQVSRGSLSAWQAESILKMTGVPVRDARNGLTFPRLDIAAAIAATPHVDAQPRRRGVRK
ncbi:MAG TPA: S8 family serine peptidase [Thermoanaerobaculia bacterium]|nr:S8 family serine peptidase [Thermoanaerobaculia bacterium]